MNSEAEDDRQAITLDEDVILLLTDIGHDGIIETEDAIGADTKSVFEKNDALTPGAVSSSEKKVHPPSTELFTEQLATEHGPMVTPAADSKISNAKAMFRWVRQQEPTSAVVTLDGGTTSHTMVTPGAVSVVPNYIIRNSLESDDEYSDEHGEVHDQLHSNNTSDSNAALMITAHLADDDAILDEYERQRILNEAMRNISDQAVEANIVVDDSKLVRRNRAIIWIVLCLVTAMVLALGINLGIPSSSNLAMVLTATPTMSPTPYLAGDNVFQTTIELQNAVDAYFLALQRSENGTMVGTPDVVIRYGPIRTWNVSLITNFSRLFDPIRNDLLSWTTLSNVYYALDQDIGEASNIGGGSSSSKPSTEFDTVRQFNEDLSGWDVSNAESMMGMFCRSDYFVGSGLDNWNVGKVKDFSFLFMGASVFQGNLSKWDTSSAENMESMFFGALKFKEVNLSWWDVSNVTDMNHMFTYAEKFVGNGISSWNVSRVLSMDAMFSYAYQFNGDLSTWDTRSVSTISQMVRE
jgi:surface protein